MLGNLKFDRFWEIFCLTYVQNYFNQNANNQNTVISGIQNMDGRTYNIKARPEFKNTNKTRTMYIDHDEKKAYLMKTTPVNSFVINVIMEYSRPGMHRMVSMRKIPYFKHKTKYAIEFLVIQCQCVNSTYFTWLYKQDPTEIYKKVRLK